jgi:sarcosine oxidase subunit beta
VGKIILCRCEDVALKDVQRALDEGYHDIEEVKRFTGFGTGPCQGKECQSLIAAVVHQQTSAEVQPFTARAPIVPTPLALLAGQSDEEDAD